MITASFTRGIIIMVLLIIGLVMSGCYTILNIQRVSSPPISEPDSLNGGPEDPVPEDPPPFPPPRPHPPPPSPDPPIVIIIDNSPTPTKERSKPENSRQGSQGNTRNTPGERQKKSRR